MPRRCPPDQPANLPMRGVYEEQYMGPEGQQYLVAIDHNGHRILGATIYPRCEDPAVITMFLRAVLDREDPLLRLLP